MKRTLLTILCLVAAMAPVTLSAAPVKVTAAVDSTVMEMGSRAVVTVNVVDPSHGGAVVDMPKAGPVSRELDIVSVDSASTPAGYEYRMTIQAFVPGMLTLPPFQYVKGGDTTRSDVVTVKVLPVPLDSAQTLNPMDTIAEMPRKWYDYIPDWTVWVVIGLVILAAVAAIVWLVILYRRTGSILPIRPKVIDPYAEAIKALENLRSRHLPENGHDKEYYTSLIDILRIYLSRRFGINAMEMSSTQILHSLRGNPETRNDQPRIRTILEIADMVKFANERPVPDDNVKSYNTVLQFVESTKPLPPEPDEAKPQKTKK